MTGIEKLRELAEGIDAEVSVWMCAGDAYNEEHGLSHADEGGPIGAALLDIAGQIERERACDGDTAENIRLIVGGVVDEMKLHCLGVEGMEDSPVARWERELREALAGHEDEEVEDVATIRKDAMEAYEWVCEHGGLSHVKDIYHDLRAVVERLGVEWSESELHGLMGVLDRRLMPEGMEWLLEVWPKWSNGEYCKFGDWWTADKYGDYEPRQLRRLAFYTPEQLREWEQDEGDNFGYEWDFMRPSDTTYRPDKVEPPSPKVLDADGVEIRVGDRVWDTRNGDALVVHAIEDEGHTIACRYVDVDDGAIPVHGMWSPSWITHRAPVLAADGKPLREGEHVYHVETGAELVVKGLPKPGEYQAVVVFTPPAGHLTSFEPDQLAHERPVADTWERLEEDAGKNPFDYCKDVGHRLDTCENSEAYKARDLVRRARALAERDA